MPKIYKRVCNYCEIYYEGRGEFYCSNSCAAKIENKLRASKISVSMKGRQNRLGTTHTKEWKVNASARLKQNNPSFNMAIKEKISKSLLSYWDEIGRKAKRYHHARNTKYKEWRDTVFKRDDYTCRDCGKKGEYLEAHHIKSWSKYPQLRYDITNGLTLCKKCHKRTDNYGNKKERQMSALWA